MEFVAWEAVGLVWEFGTEMRLSIRWDHASGHSLSHWVHSKGKTYGGTLAMLQCSIAMVLLLAHSYM